jgi:hypothetical protein
LRDIGDRSPEHQHFADRLHQGAAQSLGQFGGHGGACCAVIALYPDLDEAVRAQRSVGFRANGVGQSGISDHDNW